MEAPHTKEIIGKFRGTDFTAHAVAREFGISFNLALSRLRVMELYGRAERIMHGVHGRYGKPSVWRIK